MRFHLSSLLALLVVGLLVAANPVQAAVEGHFDGTLTVSGLVDLEVETGSGSITIRPGSADKVEIHASIRASSGWHVSDSDAEAKVHSLESNPPIVQDGNTIRVGHIEDKDLSRNISISYELVVPAATHLRAQSGSGSQTIQGVEGPVDSNTGAGSLRISEIGKEVWARTGSGSIEVDSVHGSLRASTGSGSIRAIGIAGGLNASTGSGSVKLEQTAPGDVEVSTGSGGVELTGIKGAIHVSTGSGSVRAEGEPAGEWRLHTASGSVTVRLPEQAAFDLEARTSSGHIESSHPITVQGTIGPHEFHGKARGGGPVLELSTSSGNIHIE
jgi:DUF4097 and DUF4098 domain-containing protein YvlB